MKYDNENEKISLDHKEIDIIDTAIVELGGPFHSPFAKHLQIFHIDEFDNIKKELNVNGSLKVDNLHLMIDILQVFLIEPLESDWGTTYVNISKSEVQDLLDKLVNLYSEQVRKY